MASPACAQMETREGIALQNQILDLRHQLDQLRAQGAGGGSYTPPPARAPAPVSGDITVQLLDRVSLLEEEVRRLRGVTDELNNRLQQMNADLGKQISDLSFQMQPGNGGGRSAPPLPTGNLAAASPPAAAAPPHRTPEMAMQDGNAALARRDYPAAEAAAKEVMASRGPRAADAQFLYAQALNGERNYPAAAVAYNDTYQRSPTGTHAGDALLGLANALSALNDNRSACDALNKLRAEIPNPRPDLATQIAAARARTQCR
jgi:TolA-binding protein